MYFHDKLKEYFVNKGLKNRQIAEKTGYSEAMIGRYLSKSKPNYEFIMAIVRSYPDIDLNKLFKEDYTDTEEQEVSNSERSSKKIILGIERDLKVLKKNIGTV